MKKIFPYAFICLCSFGLAQTATVPGKINSKSIPGRFIGSRIYEHTTIKIKRSHRYKRHEYVFNPVRNSQTGIVKMSVGKWEIQNDTLILTEKFYKQKSFRKTPSRFFAFKHKIKHMNEQNGNQVTKLVLSNGKWVELNDTKYTCRLVYTQYILKGLTWKPVNLTAGL